MKERRPRQPPGGDGGISMANVRPSNRATQPQVIPISKRRTIRTPASPPPDQASSNPTTSSADPSWAAPDQALRLINAMFKAGDLVNLCTIHPATHKLTGTTVRIGPASNLEIGRFVTRNSGRANCYVGANPLRTAVDTK